MRQIAWVQNLVEEQGWYRANKIVGRYGREMIGGGTMPNPMYSYYLHARSWIKKNAPPNSLNKPENEVEIEEEEA